ncbi:hypothetical protein BDSB_14700 [Burkholderia dolosa PC543]|nr:hypothetical protein BDSB_14700 [Burkholderia dolosa PC543]
MRGPPQLASLHEAADEAARGPRAAVDHDSFP